MRWFSLLLIFFAASFASGASLSASLRFLMNAHRRKAQYSFAANELAAQTVRVYVSWSSGDVDYSVVERYERSGAVFGRLHGKLIEIAGISTGSSYNDTYGYGKVDAYAAVNYLLGVRQQTPASAPPHLILYPNPTNGSCLLVGLSGEIEILDIAGHIVAKSLELGGLPTGLYIVRDTETGEAANLLLMR